MKEPVLNLKEKTTQHWFPYFQIACRYYKSVITHPLNNILWQFRYMYILNESPPLNNGLV